VSIVRAASQRAQLVDNAQVQAVQTQEVSADELWSFVLSSGQKLQGVQEFIHFLFQVKHDVSQMVEAIAQDAFGFTPMLVELERLDLIERFAR
jgi:hypothetical protein